jgi:signal transduction histidine kinase
MIPMMQSRYKQGENEIYIYELEHPCINGTTVWTETTMRYIIDEENGQLMMFGSARDITLRKNAENEIMVKNEELQKLNAQKDKFFSIIAHDLKSPFNSIFGYSHLLLEQVNEKDYDEVENYAAIILKSSERAMDLLANLMEWARSQTGRLEFKPKNTDMVDMINQIIMLFNDIAGQKSITIKKAVPLKMVAWCDKEMIDTVIRNLISNAVKFSMPGGEIIITLTEYQNKLVLRVQDNGVGIPKDRLHTLFQIDESYSTEGTQREKGTGLGLILCKEFVEKHGGTIKVESELGKGSNFIITMPLHYEVK